MNQTISIDESQIDFLKNFSLYGFQNQEELVKEALNRLRRDLEKKSLAESANLYAEIYAEDSDLRQLTESALAENVND
jgi:hypothetical protein